MGLNASLADVAQEAGVSQQTVSRVANGRGQVSAATRAKVVAAMHKVGYRPNYAAKALRRGSFQALGLAMFDITATGNIGLLDGITEAASSQGYAVTVRILGDEDRTLAGVERAMARLPVDGIIVVMERMLTDLDTFTRRINAPMTIITAAPVRSCSTIDADQAQGARLAVDCLHSQGHKRIAFVSGPSDSVASQIRQDSYERTMKGLGLPALVAGHGDWTADSGYAIGTGLVPKIESGEVTAVFAANDNMANGIWQALLQAGLRIPQDVSLLGVDNSLTESIPHLRLDSLDQHFIGIGRQAVDITLQAARKQERTGRTPKPEHRLVDMDLVRRGSVGPVPVL